MSILKPNSLKKFSAVSGIPTLDIHVWSIAHYSGFLFDLDHLVVQNVVDLLGDSKFGLKFREIFPQFREILFNTFQVLLQLSCKLRASLILSSSVSFLRAASVGAISLKITVTTLYFLTLIYKYICTLTHSKSNEAKSNQRKRQAGKFKRKENILALFDKNRKKQPANVIFP